MGKLKKGMEVQKWKNWYLALSFQLFCADFAGIFG
jgi:hypothetical protein